MESSKIRKSFLDFFKSKGHTIIPSASLVPDDDPTLLFTGAGMNQFKENFLGIKKDLKRAASCQKCIRTLDLDKVGKSAGHHTFFEMLGNFSFGDYFKKEAIEWAWEYLANILKIKEEKLWASVYHEDDESYEIWMKVIKLPKDKIVKLGEVENFWPADAKKNGPNGPCGPCSEIFFDQGVKKGCGKAGCNPACDCGRFLEVWNLVFTQFDRYADGSLKPLPNKNIDTGMGLERMTRAMQGVLTNYETDLFVPIIKSITDLLDTKERKKLDKDNYKRFIKAISDHARAATFLICDGVLPSNEGRGYVERMLIRHSYRYGMHLGFNGPFLYKVVPSVVKIMADTYPQLVNRRENISQIILAEEKRFQATLKEGTKIIKETIHNLKKKKKECIDGETLFRLYDTYGIPIELTQEIAADFKFKVDKVGFEDMMKKQRSTSRARSKIQQDKIFVSVDKDTPKVLLKQTRFIGYEKNSCQAQVLGILKDAKEIKEAHPADVVGIILDKTPFYAQAGGQVGDKGLLENKNLKVEVYDTKFQEKAIVHFAKIVKGVIKIEEDLTASVDISRRLDIARNHTATHLLQAALRETLGQHVHQSGSLVDSDRLRFDFTHFQGLTQEELDRIESLVNNYIRTNNEVKKEILNQKEAIKQGALALFSQKYQEKVRVISIGSYSKELCGGTHLDYTGQIGLFKIISESSISAGVRRIEAVCGEGAYRHIKKEEAVLEEIAAILKSNPQNLIDDIKKLTEHIRELERRASKGLVESKKIEIDDMTKKGLVVNGSTVFVEFIEKVGLDELRRISDRLLKEGEKRICVVLSLIDTQLNIVVAATKLAIDNGIHAGSLANDIAKIFNGAGGGNPRLGQGGARNIETIDLELLKNKTIDIIKNLIHK